MMWRAEANPIVLDEETKELSNKVMMKIFSDINDSKERFPELKYFNESALSKNAYGIFEIRYENKEYLSPRRDYHYQFALGIVGISDPPYRNPNSEDIDFSFPVIGLKFTGFQTKSIRGRHYDLNWPINTYSPILYDHQQKYIKLKLSIIPEKTVYKVDERINFKVQLKNTSSQNLKVQPLNEKTLYFTIGDKVWGTKPDAAKPGEFTREEILYSGYDIARGFKGDSFSVPGEVVIRCTFNMVYQGVMPMASVKLKIIPQ